MHRRILIELPMPHTLPPELEARFGRLSETMQRLGRHNLKIDASHTADVIEALERIASVYTRAAACNPREATA